MTAIEFLFDAVYKDMSYPELLGLIAQAKIIEKQQQGYSEEEVNVLISLLKQTTEYEVLQSFREKVEQFKNK